MSDADGAPRVGLVGPGTLGLTAAHAALAAGSPVTLFVRGSAERRRARAEEMHVSVEREVRRGRIDATVGADMLARLRVTGVITDLRDVDVVIESVPEDPSLKRQVVETIEDVVRPDTLIASTSSSIPAAWIARDARRPERIVVAHYVWPAHRMPLVEVACHEHTSAASLAALDDLLAGQGKTQVRVADRPGFLITRALFAYWDAAVQLVRDGCSPHAVDEALERFGFPMGPLRVMEGTGLDSVARIHASLAPHLDHEFRSFAALCEVVAQDPRAADSDGPPLRLDEPMLTQLRQGRADVGTDDTAIVELAVGALAIEVARAVSEGIVATWDDGGRAIDLAYGFPPGRGGLHRWWLADIAAKTDRSASLVPS
jgi:3-hydroxyacyl-CoA dehydrogenase